MTAQTAQRYKLTVEYDGTDFYGWQRQPGLPTVQGHIESAIHKFCGQNVNVQCAGRTDAGVHAYSQMAHVDLEELNNPMQPFEIAKAINAHLREQPIRIIDVAPVSEEFHARFSAKNKLYLYRILNRQASPALEEGRLWHIKKSLDTGAMQAAADLLLGRHDFSAFRDSECQAKNPVRTLDRLSVQEKPYDAFAGREITIEAEAESFLHHMVRNIVGTLVFVGEGKWHPEDMKRILQTKDRTKAGPTAPAAGLYLKRIDYV